MAELRVALRATVGKRGMTEEDIGALADYLMSFFGFDSEVIDNRLDMDDRDVFYMLEEAGLLGTRQEEIHIKKGNCGGSTTGSSARAGSSSLRGHGCRRRRSADSRTTISPQRRGSAPRSRSDLRSHGVPASRGERPE